MTLLQDMTEAHLRWASPTLAGWYTPSDLRERAEVSMSEQASWVADIAFGANFRACLPEVPVDDPGAWANRRLELPDDEWCVAGIRFRGMDFTRPFVDVVATSVPPTASNIARLCHEVLPDFQEFSPRAVRIEVGNPDRMIADLNAAPDHLGGTVDQYVVAGLIDSLRAQPMADDVDRVTLVPLDVHEAVGDVERIYGAMHQPRPFQDEWAMAATREELQDCADEDLLFRIAVDDRSAGVLGVCRCDQHDMTGFVINEIVLDNQHRGDGLARPALERLLRLLPSGLGDTLWGTIHPDNTASLRNALSLGREIVSGYVWVTPPGFPGMAPSAPR